MPGALLSTRIMPGAAWRITRAQLFTNYGMVAIQNHGLHRLDRLNPR